MQGPSAAINRLLALLAAAMLYSAAAGAQAREDAKPSGADTPIVAVESQTDVSGATIGDIVLYTATATFPRHTIPDAPRLEPLPRLLELVDSGAGRAIESGEMMKQEFWFRLRADGVGVAVFPKLELSYKQPDPNDPSRTVTGKAESNVVQVEVRSVLPQKREEAQDIRGIKPLAGDETVLPPEWIVAGAVMAVLLLTGLLLAPLPGKKDDAKGEEALSPHAFALKQLEKLQAEKLVERGLHREHYFKLSEILRCYLEARFGFPAPDWTSEEIAAWLRQHRVLDELHYRQALELLEESDRIKFARGEVSPEKAGATLRRTAEFIAGTQPKEATPAPSAP